MSKSVVACLMSCALPFMAAANDPVLLTAQQVELYEAAKADVSIRSFVSLSPFHQRMVSRIAAGNDTDTSSARPAFCFSGPMPDDVMRLFNRSFFGVQKFEENLFRWSETATDGGGLVQGEPITLRYSFIPDGTMISGNAGIGNSNAPSNFQAFMTGIYGSVALWQAEFAQAFAEWGDITGTTYVFEPNDDGGTFPDPDGPGGLPGLTGVRGDVRIGGYSIDGESGPSILAFNFFPNEGDMVFDTDNISFYSLTSGDSLLLRNVIAHEHGHGLGMPHTCPLNQTKLMEPSVSANFDGPQLDDRLSAQKHYGDANLGNSSIAAATDLGDLLDETVTESLVSLSGNNEEDYYAFTLVATHEIVVTVAPEGETYVSGVQDELCDTGSAFSPQAFMNLDVQLIGPDGTTVLDTGNTAGIGAAETVGLDVAASGTYFLRVFTSGAADNVQAYEVTVAASVLPGPVITNPSGGGRVALDEGSVTLSLSVSGTVDPTTYEWSKDGSPLFNTGTLSGADTTALTIDPIELQDSGAYRLTVTDSAAKLVTVSDAIVLEVVTALPVAGILAAGALAAGIVAAGAWTIRRRKN